MTQLFDTPPRYKGTTTDSYKVFVQRGRPETRFRKWESEPRPLSGNPLELWERQADIGDFAFQPQEHVVGWMGPKDSELAHLGRIHYLTLGSERLHSADVKKYFRRKISEVLNDDDALRLLANIYETSVVEKASFDQRGAALAKLTAANFCEIGAKVVYITDAGRRFIDTIKQT